MAVNATKCITSTLYAFSKENKVPLKEILELNPNFKGITCVPVGTPVKLPSVDTIILGDVISFV